MSKIVIALGGNALGNTPEEQLKLLDNVSKISGKTKNGEFLNEAINKIA